jgi:hypothetical protein
VHPIITLLAQKALIKHKWGGGGNPISDDCFVVKKFFPQIFSTEN